MKVFQMQLCVKDMLSDNFMNIGFSRKNKTEERPNKGKGVQCYECEGYGHTKAKCPTFLKNKKGGMSPTYYNEDSRRECEDGIAKWVKAFAGKCDSDNKSCDEGVSYEELADPYKELCARS